MSRIERMMIGALMLTISTCPLAASTSGDPVPVPSMRVPLASKAPLVAAVRAGQGIVAVGDYGVVVTASNGSTWQQSLQVPVDTLLTAACFADEKRGWAVGHGGVILSTQDGGARWQLRHRVDRTPVLLSVACLGDEQVLVVGAYGTALRTKDGRTWTQLHVGRDRDADLHLNAVVAGNPGTLVVAAEGGAAFRSSDDGETWTRVPTNASGSLWGALRLRDSSVMLYGMSGRIIVSRDDGQTWTPVASDTGEALTGATQLGDGRIVLVGNGGVVTTSTAAPLSFKAEVRPDRQALSAVAEGGASKLFVFGAAGVAEHGIAPTSKR